MGNYRVISGTFVTHDHIGHTPKSTHRFRRERAETYFTIEKAEEWKVTNAKTEAEEDSQREAAAKKDAEGGIVSDAVAADKVEVKAAEVVKALFSILDQRPRP